MRQRSGLSRASEGSTAVAGGTQTAPSVLEDGHSSPIRDIRDSSSSCLIDGDMDNTTTNRWSEIQERPSSTGGTVASTSTETTSSGHNSNSHIKDESGYDGGGTRWSMFRERSGGRGTLGRSRREPPAASNGSGGFDNNMVIRGAGRHSTGYAWSPRERRSEWWKNLKQPLERSYCPTHQQR